MGMVAPTDRIASAYFVFLVARPAAEIGSTMKPWGSQPTFSTFFQSVTHCCQSLRREFTVFERGLTAPPRQQREASGVQGAAMSPLVAVRMLRNLGTDVRSCFCRCVSPWGAIDYASCGAAAGRLAFRRRQSATVRRRRPSYLNTPRRPFVTDSLQRQSPVPSDSPSCELTRRFP